MEAIFPSTGSYFSANPSFRLVETCFLFTGNIIFFVSSFFLLMETINEIRENLFLRTSHTPASGHLFFQFFQRFSKEKQFFCIVETYFLISLNRLVQKDFLLSGKSIFLVRAILLLVETIIGIKSKQSKKELILATGQLIFWLVETIFSFHFLEAPASNSFFRLVERAFQENCSF